MSRSPPRAALVRPQAVRCGLCSTQEVRDSFQLPLHDQSAEGLLLASVDRDERVLEDASGHISSAAPENCDHTTRRLPVKARELVRHPARGTRAGESAHLQPV